MAQRVQVVRKPVPRIVVQVLGQDDIICIRYKIKKSTPFKKLFRMYCRFTGSTLETLRFRFNGEEINENDTPASMKLRNEDTIEVFQLMSGGSFCLDC